MTYGRKFKEPESISASELSWAAGPIKRKKTDEEAAERYKGQLYQDDPRAGTGHDAAMYGKPPVKPDVFSQCGSSLAGDCRRNTQRYLGERE